jgi:ATP-dependent exoDNAse (exonuclease V) beta subunit
VRDVQAYFDLVEQLESSSQFSSEQLAREVEKLFAAPDALAPDTLQFMTIHKSKGLEFDTVILPGLHRGGASDDKPLLLWEEVAMEGVETQLVAAPLMPKRDGAPSIYDYLRLLEKERSDNEDARVLYVGATRAIRSLHLVGVARTDAKTGEARAPANTPLVLLWNVIGAHFMQAAVGEVARNDADISTFTPPLVRLERPAVAEQLSGNNFVGSSIFEELSEPEQTGTRLDADIGTLAHRYVEIMALGDLHQWSPQRIRELQPAMQRWLIQHGHAEADASRGAGRVASALSATLSSEQGRWVLKAREQAAAEMALVTVEGTRDANHIVDRTFVENGERWVIDYKSARLGEVSEDAMEQQAEQYRAQLERYARLFMQEGLPVRKAVFFLAYGRMVELP